VSKGVGTVSKGVVRVCRHSLNRLGGLLLLLAFVAGCAASSDGGAVGSGISAAMVSGNIVAVTSPNSSPRQRQSAAAALEPVVVTIDEAPAVIGDTDADGNFLLDGDFSGPLTVRFSTPTFTATQLLDVPAGSAVVLQDISIRPGVVRIGSLRQLHFFGTVAFTGCESNVLVVNDRKPTPDQFLVWLRRDTSIVDAEGEAVACTSLRDGQSLSVEGAIQPSTRSITALAIEVAPPPTGAPQLIEQVRLAGTISVVNCDSAMILLNGPTGLSRVRLSPSTVIEGGIDHQPLTCQDLAAGNLLDGQGLINIRAPGVIDAQSVTVTAAAVGGN
jgi:hypothetical protein